MTRIPGLAVVVALAGGCGGEPGRGALREAAGEQQRAECRGSAGPAIALVHGIGSAVTIL
ncbi:hypothetical protein [Actinoplanes sp. RD1]|uniref:hypothetical protein n=1 Tax=Actinoplanes sp. RD1 TaxID=3064538 RepID=UPI0027409841|nr:hypothetical protein [Actinoplanes sp. RD1]